MTDLGPRTTPSDRGASSLSAAPSCDTHLGPLTERSGENAEPVRPHDRGQGSEHGPTTTVAESQSLRSVNGPRTTQGSSSLTAARRCPEVEACFDYDAIAALVEWNVPDHEHTRIQLRGCLHDLVETAIRDQLERGL